MLFALLKGNQPDVNVLSRGTAKTQMLIVCPGYIPAPYHAIMSAWYLGRAQRVLVLPVTQKLTKAVRTFNLPTHFPGLVALRLPASCAEHATSKGGRACEAKVSSGRLVRGRIRPLVGGSRASQRRIHTYPEH